MAETKTFNFTGRLRSFRYAFRGILLMLKTQHNAWIHALISAIVIISAICLNVSKGEWCWLIIAITTVWMAEAFNTAFEFLCDVASPEFHPMVEKSKDVAAGAVLLAAVGAVLIGVIVFGPKLLNTL